MKRRPGNYDDSIFLATAFWFTRLGIADGPFYVCPSYECYFAASEDPSYDAFLNTDGELVKSSLSNPYDHITVASKRSSARSKPFRSSSKSTVTHRNPARNRRRLPPC